MSRWFILRTSGGQTLAVAASLREAGFEAWTPARVVRRSMPAKTPSGRRWTESDAPILPTFVFVAEPHLEALAAAQALRSAGVPSPYPPFSIYHVGGRVPFIGAHTLGGLRDEEGREAARIAALRAAESHAEAERIRIAAIRSEAARRRAMRDLERTERAALRARPCPATPGAVVEVAELPAFVGVTGILEAIDGPYARVRFGTQSWKIEGWRVCPSTLSTIAA